ncbi:MAG TPA: histidine kinase [Candidatus Kapabacteria bacterium]|nr:histidine kinase [Candidatus Kapabacteria bacterium]
MKKGNRKESKKSIEKGKIEMVIKMKANGIGVDIISKISGLSVEEIEKLGS